MRQGSPARNLVFGFTIIEVMIVLAVSSILLVAAIAAIAGQQQKTEFTQAVREIESQVKDIINDVSHGFYPNTNNFSCSANGSGPVLASGSGNQGANKDCIFIGRVIQFGVAGSSGKSFNIYTLVGQRQVDIGAGPHEVSSINEARPVAIAPSSSSGNGSPDATDQKSLNFGLNAQTMKYVSGSTSTNIGAVAFVSDLAKLKGDNLQSGTPAVNLMPIAGTSLNQSSLAAVDSINNLNNNSPVNPSGGVVICFASGGTKQHGILTIGSNGRALSTDLTINNGSCP